METSAADKEPSSTSADKEHFVSPADEEASSSTSDQLSEREKLEARKRKLEAWRVHLERDRLYIVKVQMRSFHGPLHKNIDFFADRKIRLLLGTGWAGRLIFGWDSINRCLCRLGWGISKTSKGSLSDHTGKRDSPALLMNQCLEGNKFGKYHGHCYSTNIT